jgi:small-conductance mechanosensitive channel
MWSVLQASTLIVKNPPPVVALKSIDAIAIEAELQFRVDSLAVGTSAKNEIIDLLHDQSRVRGLSLAMPTESLVFVPASSGNEYPGLSKDEHSFHPV